VGGAAENKSGPIYLCRCGQSANKPFCDSTHRKIKFEAPAAEQTIG
jgi:CDGSH-type Zn-finger protein